MPHMTADSVCHACAMVAHTSHTCVPGPILAKHYLFTLFSTLAILIPTPPWLSHSVPVTHILAKKLGISNVKTRVRPQNMCFKCHPAHPSNTPSPPHPSKYPPSTPALCGCYVRTHMPHMTADSVCHACAMVAYTSDATVPGPILAKHYLFMFFSTLAILIPTRPWLSHGVTVTRILAEKRVFLNVRS
jgi:hypothetical protein